MNTDTVVVLVCSAYGDILHVAFDFTVVYFITQAKWIFKWREMQLLFQQKQLLCDITVQFVSQRLQRRHRLDDHLPLSWYIIASSAESANSITTQCHLKFLIETTNLKYWHPLRAAKKILPKTWRKYLTD